MCEQFGYCTDSEFRNVPILPWNVEANPRRRTFNAEYLPMPRLPAGHDKREPGLEGIILRVAHVEAEIKTRHRP